MGTSESARFRRAFDRADAMKGGELTTVEAARAYRDLGGRTTEAEVKMPEQRGYELHSEPTLRLDATRRETVVDAIASRQFRAGGREVDAMPSASELPLKFDAVTHLILHNFEMSDSRSHRKLRQSLDAGG